MKDYCFFFSYSSADRNLTTPESEVTDKNDHLKRFFNDLNQEIKGRYRDGGFFDKNELRGYWRKDLSDGMATSRVLMPIYSKSYFASKYCAKEWEVFRQRSRETPNVLLPIFWEAPPTLTIPAEVGDYQTIIGDDYPAEYKVYGLDYIMKMRPYKTRYKAAYQQFLLKVKNQLLALSDAQGVGRFRSVPKLEDLFPPFPTKRCRGLKQVYYIFLAGVKADMAQRQCDCYGERYDGADWLPCFPNVRKRVGEIIETATKPDRVVEILTPYTDDRSRREVIEELREADRRNNAVVLLVDPWSLDLPGFKPFVESLASEAFPNAAILVNWNENDQETRTKPELLDTANARFARFFHQRVSSESDFSKSVGDAFEAIRAKLTELGRFPSADPDMKESVPVIGTKP